MCGVLLVVSRSILREVIELKIVNAKTVNLEAKRSGEQIVVSVTTKRVSE